MSAFVRVGLRLSTRAKMQKPLKFCMVTTFYPPYHFGGDATYIYRLTNELARQGHFVDVIHCKDSYSLLTNDGAKAGYENHPNVKVYGLKSRAGALSPFLTQQTGMPVLKRNFIKSKLEENGYDVIHYHNMSLVGITALSYGNAIKLYTTHEHWLVCPMHVLWKYNREVCKDKSCFICTLVHKRPPQFWRYTNFLQRTLRNIDTFLSPSRFTMGKHLENGLDIPIIHIPYFLPQTEETEDISGSLTSSINDRPYFLFVGRLEKIKGLQNLIPVFKRYGKYDLLIAGDGTYESVLRELTGDAPNIKFLGRLSLEELQGYYQNAVAVIVPSICYEVFGIIIIEAFSMKTPVIVNNLGAMPEVIEDSGGGFVYSTEDQLINALEKLGSNPDLRDSLGEKGYDAFLKYWSEDAHIKSYMNLIDRLMQKKRKKGVKNAHKIS
jgi:glycosyltransferase involved in cell wall biosynthesis